MKTLKYLFTIIFLAVILNGCDDNVIDIDSDFDSNQQTITGSGNLIEMEMGFNNFRHIESHYSFNINIVRSDYYSVTIKIDDNLMSIDFSALEWVLTNFKWFKNLELASIRQLEIRGEEEKLFAKTSEYLSFFV